jgi:hypothetical protein
MGDKATTEIILSFVALAVGYLLSMGIILFVYKHSTISAAFSFRDVSTYFMLTFIPFAWLTIGLLIPHSGCLTMLAVFLISPFVSAIFYLIYIGFTAHHLRLSIQSKAKGVLSELFYLIIHIAITIVLYFYFLGRFLPD